MDRKWAVCALYPALTPGFYAIIVWLFTSSHGLLSGHVVPRIRSGGTAAWLGRTCYLEWVS